jgi:hypothetical protein
MPVPTALGLVKKGLAEFAQAPVAGQNPALAGVATIDQALSVATAPFVKAADGAAATATADTLFWTNPFGFPVYVEAGSFVGTGAGITADNTNFATLIIKTNDGIGGATAIALSMATTITDAGTFTQNQPKSFTGRTLANVTVPANGGLWLQITKSGTGVVVPAGYFTVRVLKAET